MDVHDPPRILAVDDTPENLEILRIRLEANGYEVFLAADGEEVLVVEWYAAGYAAVTSVLPLSTVAVGLFVPDYILTCVVAMIRRRPSYLFYGLFYLPLRLLDSYLMLITIPQAWTTKSDGRWKSPTRMPVKTP